MKHSIVIKFLILLMTACSALIAIGGGVSIVAIESADLYVNSLDALQDQQYESTAQIIAHTYAQLYAVEKYSNLTYSMRQEQYVDPDERGDRAHWTLELRQGSDILVKADDPLGYSIVKDYTYTPKYPIVSLLSPNKINQGPEPGLESVTAPKQAYSGNSAFLDNNVPEGYLFYDTRTEWEGTQRTLYYYYYYEAPEYTVTVYMQPEVLENSPIHVLTALYPLRYHAIAALALGILCFAIGIVFLCWSAGRTKSGEIRPGGLNRLPLDLYAVIVVVLEYLLVWLFTILWDWTQYSGPHIGNLSLVSVNILAAVCLVILFIFAFAAQAKLKDHYWWKHTVIGFCLSKLWQGIRFCLRSLHSLIRMMPVMWQWLLTAFCVAFATFLTLLLAANGAGPFSAFLFLMSIAACVGIICYGGYAFGTLLIGARKMSQGHLNHKIPTKYLVCGFRDFAQQLNTLSEAAMLTAQRQMKSERMKTELITNVSHDIKTPLTSIINFVDLLQKPHTPQEGEEYLDVLSRQSARMKKLIEDLMDLSKASTGNISANIEQIDAVETVNQALGEFSDKLTASQLSPVFRRPEGPVMILADGRLAWRVISNLLSNAVKYAMPGTRLYVDLLRADGQVVLSLKNISRQELCVSAEDLMERFVQGDASRNTEGSGLGLNIARSLMEVQGGRLHLTLDGDLFKVTLVFPGV